MLRHESAPLVCRSPPLRWLCCSSGGRRPAAFCAPRTRATNNATSSTTYDSTGRVTALGIPSSITVEQSAWAIHLPASAPDVFVLQGGQQGRAGIRDVRVGQTVTLIITSTPGPGNRGPRSHPSSLPRRRGKIASHRFLGKYWRSRFCSQDFIYPATGAELGIQGFPSVALELFTNHEDCYASLHAIRSLPHLPHRCLAGSAAWHGAHSRRLAAAVLRWRAGELAGGNLDGSDASELRTPDKSQYNLFNPTPDDLLRPFSSSRPDQTTGPHSVDAGHYYLETGLAYSLGLGATRTDTWNYFQSTHVRIGLLNNVELELIWSGLDETRTRTVQSGGHARSDSDITGATDLTVRTALRPRRQRQQGLSRFPSTRKSFCPPSRTTSTRSTCRAT